MPFKFRYDVARRSMAIAAATAVSAISVQFFSGCSSDVTAGNKGSLLGTLDVQHKPDFEDIQPRVGSFDYVNYDLAKIIIPLGNTEFAMLRKLDDAQFTLDRVNDSLDLAWSFPIHTGEEGYQTALFRSGANICAIMTEFTESDSVKAVAYVVDATTGKLVKTLTLDARPGSVRWLRRGPKGFGPYRIQYSIDGSRILLSNRDYSAQSDDTMKIITNAVMIDNDLNVLSRSTLPLMSVSHKNRSDYYYGALPADNGSIVQFLRRGLDTIEIIRTLPSEGNRQISARYVMPRSADGDLPLEIAPELAGGCTANNDAVVAIGCQLPDKPRLMGVRILKFPASGSTPTLMADYTFSDEVARRMVDEKYFENYQIRDLDLSIPNRALVFVERAYQETKTYSYQSAMGGGSWRSRDVTFLEYGPLLVFAFDSTATNKWRVALMKKQETTDLGGSSEVGHSRRVDHDGNLQVVYMDRDNDGLIWGKMGVEDGGVKQFETPLIFGKGSSYFRNYTTWMNDSTMIIAGTKSFGGDRMQLYKVRYLASPAAKE